jgi:ElaB/YqjD/DUF883 family membrane-anchored ribosome-binding protein
MKIEKDIQEKIQQHLNQGKEKLAWLENQINDEKNHQKLQFKLAEAKEKIAGLKKTYTEFEEKAVHYTEKNPKKALAIATVAGILAASLWNAFQKKATLPPAKPARKTKKKAVKPAHKAKKPSAAIKN